MGWTARMEVVQYPCRQEKTEDDTVETEFVTDMSKIYARNLIHEKKKIVEVHHFVSQYLFMYCLQVTWIGQRDLRDAEDDLYLQTVE